MLVAAARLRPGRPRGARASRSSAGTARASPTTSSGEAIPLADARRAPQPRHGGDRPHLLAGARARRRPRSPRPHLRPGARRPVRRARARVVRAARATTEPWDAVLALEPEPRRLLDGRRRSTTRSTVAADFIDLKSPYMGGHSRRCAELAADAARVLGLDDEAVTTAPPGGARARLRHHRRAELDLGQARRAHADGVRPRRAAPDADRADAAPLAGARRAEPGRVARTTRSATAPATTSACAPTPATSARACWPRRRSTSG